MKDEELRGSIHRAVDTRLSGMTGDPWLGRRVISAERKNKPMMKRKFSIALIVCVIMLLASVSVAAALNLNVFELLGSRDARLQEIAADSALEDAPEITVENNKAGKSTVQITNAYYDGESLLIGYFIENASYIEEFTPSEAFLAQMTPVSDGLDPFVFSPDQAEWGKAYRHALEDHAPFGILEVGVYIKDHAQGENGVDLGPWSENGEREQNAEQYSVRDYERLPDKLKNLDALRVCLTMVQQIQYKYFDGVRSYASFESRELTPVIVTVPRTEAEIRHFTGSLAVEGVPAQADAFVSTVRLTVRFTAVDQPFEEFPADSGRWYELELTDENGHAWTDEGWHWEDDTHMSFSMTGLGVLPQTLTAHFRVVEEETLLQEITVPLSWAGAHP